jgi:hypothetical protein
LNFDGVVITPQILEERLIDFAVIIVSVVEALPNSKAGNHIANQLIRSGTYPGRIMAKLKAPNPAKTSFIR